MVSSKSFDFLIIFTISVIIVFVIINVLEKSDEKSSGSSAKEESRSPEVDTEIQMDITLEKNSSPPLSPKEYLPALQGCRSVEEFQCLNRLLELKMCINLSFLLI